MSASGCPASIGALTLRAKCPDRSGEMLVTTLLTDHREGWQHGPCNRFTSAPAARPPVRQGILHKVRMSDGGRGGDHLLRHGARAGGGSCCG